MSNTARSYDILATNLGILHILIMQQNYFQICITKFSINTWANLFFPYLFHSLNYLTWIYFSSRYSKFPIASGFRSHPSQYDAICTSRDFADWEASGARETSALRCISHPHANYPCTHVTLSLSLSEWNYRYYRLRRKRETRTHLARVRKDARFIFMVIAGVAKCVGRSL